LGPCNLTYLYVLGPCAGREGGARKPLARWPGSCKFSAWMFCGLTAFGHDCGVPRQFSSEGVDLIGKGATTGETAEEDVKRPEKERSGVTMVRVDETHRDLVLRFFQREWGAESGRDSDSPEFDPSVPQWVCIRNGEAIGYLGTIPTDFRIEGATIPGHWLKGFWVQPEFRSGPVGFMLAKRASEELDLVASSLVALPARRLLEAMGFSERAGLFNRVLLLRPGRVLGSIDSRALLGDRIPGAAHRALRVAQSLRLAWLAGESLGLGSRLLRSFRDRGSREYSIRLGWDVSDSALDELWVRCRDRVPAAGNRDAGSLRARYEASGSYQLVTVWHGEDLEAWAVVRVPRTEPDTRLAGLRVASLSDLWFPLRSPGAACAVLSGAERVAREWGSDAMVCSGTHPVLERLLSRRGYLAFPGNLRILVRDSSDSRFPAEASRAWITRGDGRSDETF
jgi:hypothetical protein